MADRLLNMARSLWRGWAIGSRPVIAGVPMQRTSWAGIGTLTSRGGDEVAAAGAREPRRRGATGGGMWHGMRAAWRRYRTRQAITALDAHALKDIGVSYAEAEYEANKPFWQS